MKRLAILLSFMLAVGVAAALATAAEKPTVWERIQAGEFVVFAEVMGVTDKQIAADGIEPITYLYGRYFQEGPNGEPVDLEHLAAEVAKVTWANNRIVVLDLEDQRVAGLTAWSHDPEQWEEHAKLADDVLNTIRGVQPEWKIGWFGRVASIDARRMNGYHAHHRPVQPPAPGSYSQWERHQEYLSHVAQQRFMAKRLGDQIDFCHPELYMGNWHWMYAHRLDDPTGNTMKGLYTVGDPGIVSPIIMSQQSPQDVWLDVTHTGLRLMKRTFVDTPIIPVISPQWWVMDAKARGDTKPPFGQFFSDQWLLQQLDLLKVHADGVVIWCSPRSDGWEPQAFMESRRWKLICDWAAKQKGE